MNFRFQRIGAVASLIAGISLISSHSIDFFQNHLNGTLLSKSFSFIGHLAALFSFVAIYELLYSKKNTITTLSMMLCVLGTVCVNISVFSDSQIALTIGTVSALLFGIGMIIFGYEMIRIKTIPTLIGICFILGTTMFIVPSMLPKFTLHIYFVGSAITCLGFCLTFYVLQGKNQ